MKKIILLSFGLGVVWGWSSFAQDYPKERNSIYEQNLDFVSKALAKRKSKLNLLTADYINLHQNPAEALLGRAYKVGDEWDTVVFYKLTRINPETVASGESDVNAAGKMTAFHYAVTQINPLQIEVTESSAQGLPTSDPSIAKVTLVFDTDFREVSKTYLGTNGSTQSAFIGGIRSRNVPLEKFEIDSPDLMQAEKIPFRGSDELLATLPKPLSTLAAVNGFHYDVVGANWMTSEDGFGRSVDLLWQSGKPWPTYVKSARGFSILLRSSN